MVISAKCSSNKEVRMEEVSERDWEFAEVLGVYWSMMISMMMVMIMIQLLGGDDD